MNFLSRWFRALSEIGIAHAHGIAQQKLLKLQNRIILFSVLVVAIQSIDFFFNGFIYIVIVNGVAICAFLSCLILNATGAAVGARFFYVAVTFFTVSHHHFFFGFASGFWLFLLNMTQAGFILFPNLKMRQLLVIALAIAIGLIGIVFWSMHVPPLYEGMTAELAERFFRNNLIRSPILLVLIAFYLVDENRKAESELGFTASKATEAAEAKSFFLSNISHELRTPMNAIKGFSDILLDLTNSLADEKKQAEFQAHLNHIRISSANLTSIIDDILDFARIETGRIAFRSKDFDLHELAKNVIQTSEFYGHKAKGIETRFEISPGLPRMIKGDAARLSQILLNLVGNAMKFTHRGFVELRIRAVEQKETAYRISFEIEDTGIGIPGEKLPYLFDSFSPVSRETAVRYGGTGLGLAISKHLVELQGGAITVMSSPGKGAIFTVILWFEKSDDADAAELRAGRDLRRARVLVAEDNDVNQILVRTLLESWNADIEIVTNGLQALGHAQKNNYDLILMDLQMPFMDGIEACEQIRLLESQAKAGIPIIALTADVLSETRKKVFAAGMNDLITKPINQAELYAALKRALGQAVT